MVALAESSEVIPFETAEIVRLQFVRYIEIEQCERLRDPPFLPGLTGQMHMGHKQVPARVPPFLVGSVESGLQSLVVSLQFSGAPPAAGDENN